MSIQTVGVIGAGQMGSGIAQVMATAGKQVILQDVAKAQLDKAKAGIENSLAKFVEKGKLTDEQRQQALTKLTFTESLDGLASVDLVVEAIIENEAIKLDLFKQLDELVQPKAILASNTSSISITKLAAATQRPEQVIGMHFMNPVPLMTLVEIIRGAQTSDATFQTIDELTKVLGKTPVVANDFPGFISNRVLMPLLNEAMFAVYEGVGTPEAVDTVMKLGMNHPMGPLKLADFIGLDTCLAILNVLYDGFGDQKYRPCPLLKQYVDAGWFGKKSGRGFYTYG
jgi:3-hydroxybutyryl-CoA dehydrogenase